MWALKVTTKDDFIHLMSDFDVHQDHLECWLTMQIPGPRTMEILIQQVWCGAQICICSKHLWVFLIQVTSVVSVKNWTPREWRPPLEPDVSGFSPTGFPAVQPHRSKPLHSVGPYPPWFATETKPFLTCA